MENEDLELNIAPSVEDTIVPAELPVVGGDVCPICGQNPCVCSTGECVPPCEIPACDVMVDDDCLASKSVSESCVGSFFGTLQESVRISWTFHLKTRKHRDHLALQEYYEGALESVDSIIEHYQGRFGVVEEPFINEICGDNISEVEYFTQLRDYVVDKRKQIFGEELTELWSDVDDLLGLIDTVLYKLTSFNENVIKSYEDFCYESICPDCDGDDCECDDDDCECEEECYVPQFSTFLTESIHCDCEGDDCEEEEEEPIEAEEEE